MQNYFLVRPCELVDPLVLIDYPDVTYYHSSSVNRKYIRFQSFV